ncbi:hypothetical protein [Mycoplasma putrefaciens]|uniref:Liporotein n=1 Tax=Mycoplasma putrefaciens (strain ATCC 15718 / NCTC 10155 / C30 KS-1 / KS-1) TaxID=743965 RepID=A0A7U3ZSE5_MYCPK|nr:hypothetical protein [Mycoplasma putrefaciens]AEM68645.1 liporotein [Mycoplasma putrefaciens KS1]
MRKLLALLSACVFTTSGVITVVACGSEEKRTDSIFIAGNGDFKITSASLLDWHKSWHGFSNDSVKFINKIYNLIAVGILDSVANNKLQLPTSTIAQERGWDESLNNQIKNLLGNKNSNNTSTLYGLANDALKDLKENTHKNNFNDYKKDLEKRFPGVRNNIKDLENAFKSDYILNDSSNSAFVRLKNLLMFNSTVSNSLWRKGIQTVKLEMKTITSEFASAYNNMKTLDELAKKIEDNFKKVGDKNGLSWSDKSIISFTNLVNSVGGVGFGDRAEENNNDSEKISINYSSSKDVKNRVKMSSSHMNNKTGTEWIKEILKRITPSAINGSSAFLNWSPTREYDGPKKFTNYNNNVPNSWSEIVDYIPSLDSDGNLAKDLISGEFGSITDSQKYSLDRYFNSEKPVMVSDLIFTFANSKTKESIQKELSLKSLIPLSSSDSDLTTELIQRFQGIGSVLKEYVKSEPNKDHQIQTAGLTRFDTIFRGDIKHIKANLTNKKEEDFSKWTQWDSSNTYHKVNKTGSLLTISDTSFSDAAKYSIYDFLTNSENNSWVWSDGKKLEESSLTEYGLSSSEAKAILDALPDDTGSRNNELNKFIKEVIANLIELFKNINQRNDGSDAGQKKNKLFTILNKDEGIIAYIDGDGLHITKIDGYKLINSEIKKVNNENNIKEQTTILKTIESLYSSPQGKVLVPYLINSMISSTNSTNGQGQDNKKWNWSENDKQRASSVMNLGIDINKLNNNIKNEYERFLVNTSLIDSTRTTIFYNTNILNEVAKATETKSDSLAAQANWILNFFTKVFNKKNTKDLFLSIVSDESDNLDLIAGMLSQQSRREKVSGITSLFAKNQEWIQSIKENHKNQIKDPSINHNFVPNYGIDLSTVSNGGKSKFEMLLTSAVFNPNKTSDQINREMSESRGDSI